MIKTNWGTTGIHTKCEVPIGELTHKAMIKANWGTTHTKDIQFLQDTSSCNFFSPLNRLHF